MNPSRRTRFRSPSLPVLLAGALTLPGSAIMAQRAPGGMAGGSRELVARFDTDGNGWLNAAERTAAVEFLLEEQKNGGGPRGPRFAGGNQPPPEPGTYPPKPCTEPPAPGAIPPKPMLPPRLPLTPPVAATVPP